VLHLIACDRTLRPIGGVRALRLLCFGEMLHLRQWLLLLVSSSSSHSKGEIICPIGAGFGTGGKHVYELNTILTENFLFHSIFFCLEEKMLRIFFFLNAKTFDFFPAGEQNDSVSCGA
jgi:hypothetical protein